MKGVIIPIVTAIIEKNGKYLMLKRSKKNKTNKNKWQFPEGKIEFGENPANALKRELKEETGLNLISAEFLNYYSSVAKFKIGSAHLLRLIFKCNVEGKIKLSEEHIDWGFFDIEKDKIDAARGLDIKIVKNTLKS